MASIVQRRTGVLAMMLYHRSCRHGRGCDVPGRQKSQILRG